MNGNGVTIIALASGGTGGCLGYLYGRYFRAIKKWERDHFTPRNITKEALAALEVERLQNDLDRDLKRINERNAKLMEAIVKRDSLS